MDKVLDESASKRILVVVDDDDAIRLSLALLLKKEGYQVEIAQDGEEALAKLQGFPPSVVVLDLRMPKLGGLDVIDRSKVVVPDLAIIVMTAHRTIKVAVEALQRGAFDFLTKPFEKGQMLATVKKARRYQLLLHVNRSLRRLVSTTYTFDNIIAVSSLMREVLEQVMIVAPTPSSILLLGESSTGKELIARTIHMNSRVSNRPFHALNVAGVPPQLFESMVFGHKKGAFTGAIENRAGTLEAAAGGTLFLDDVGDLAPESQVKLLRVLQEREYSRLGEDKTRRINVPFIAATNRDLKKAGESGDFREDLYYRFCVIPVHLPPIRQRPEDIPALSAYFLERAARRLERPVPKFNNLALTTLCQYDFPGNVRELENHMERLVALNRGPEIDLTALNLNVKKNNLAKVVLDKSPMGIDLHAHEKDLIVESLLRCQGSKTPGDHPRRLDISHGEVQDSSGPSRMNCSCEVGKPINIEAAKGFIGAKRLLTIIGCLNSSAAA
jgi:DNA-binding NtrC family response regulator